MIIIKLLLANRVTSTLTTGTLLCGLNLVKHYNACRKEHYFPEIPKHKLQEKYILKAMDDCIDAFIIIITKKLLKVISSNPSKFIQIERLHRRDVTRLSFQVLFIDSHLSVRQIVLFIITWTPTLFKYHVKRKLESWEASVLFILIRTGNYPKHVDTVILLLDYKELGNVTPRNHEYMFHLYYMHS